MPDVPAELELTLKSLKANRFDARFAQTAAEAREMMLAMIPLKAKVGLGDSTTLRQIGVLEELIKRGTMVINPFTQQLTRGMAENPARGSLFLQTMRETLGTDVFLASSNAVTEDGQLVSMDRAGNRIAGLIFGAPKVILPIGRNKIVKDVDKAIHRLKNVIAPAHARRKQRKTPCAVTGKCSDCDSPDRMCSVMVIFEKKPSLTDMSIILINEDLGLGWDLAWDKKRISKIRRDYYRNTWVFPIPERLIPRL